ncbi:reverse transcriptase domain, reverse transcriptase zinc-binding domain protein [Tanacetum coccineum]
MTPHHIHSWRLRKDRFPTRLNLDARGIDLDSLRCPVCNDGIESTPHLFVWCTVAAEIWCMIKDWWGLVCTPNDLDGILSWHESAQLNTKEKLCFDVVINTSTWVIWRFRNRVCFDLKPSRRDTLMEEIKTLSHH